MHGWYEDLGNYCTCISELYSALCTISDCLSSFKSVVIIFQEEKRLERRRKVANTLSKCSPRQSIMDPK